MTEAEKNFLNQATRKVLSEWAMTSLETGVLPPSLKEPYLTFALEKGWVTKREPVRLTSTGWATATAFLKR